LYLLEESAFSLSSFNRNDERRTFSSLHVSWVVSPKAVAILIDESESSRDLRMGVLGPFLFSISIVLDESEVLFSVSLVSLWSLFSFTTDGDVSGNG
jgi:hypothetical protein